MTKRATRAALNARHMLLHEITVAAIATDDGGLSFTLPPTADGHDVTYRISPTGDVTQTVLSSHYVSTACVHQLHAKCRQSCKWCDEVCRCSCHEEPTNG